MRRVYLDHSATTPVDRRVVEAMIPFLTEKFGNASSIHFFGQEARAAVDKARQEVAALIKARSKEVVFTSGGTEANNLAIRGLCEISQQYGKHIITSQIEHSAVAEVCDAMEKRGWEITRLPVYEDGIIRIEDLKAAIRPDTVLITVMAANNEIGTRQPIAEIGQIVKIEREKGNKIWFHTDAVQAAGKIEINVEEIGCDLLSISAHKLHAPKGVGALYARRGVRLQKQNFGGHQEHERRAGTESVAHIVAFGEAARLARENLSENYEHLKYLRDQFERDVEAKISDIVFNGNREHRLPHISNISFRFIEGEGLLINLDLQGIAVSTGSACSSGSLEPSPVIRALGRSDELARGAIRFSFGKDNLQEDVVYVLEILPGAVESLRKMSPLYQKKLADAACSV
ncbi:MAG: cysteine desulfurase [Acidobacteriota bacterium]|nr:cysteine desulfurase [Acidobacteriota bacterium]